jgi:hypothetical protein
MTTNLSPEHRQAMREVGLLGVQARRDRVRANIDARLPDLSDEDRAQVAEQAYRMEMRQQRLAALRRQRRRTRRAL